MEGQFYITTIAGLGVSLAGFSALLTLFRAGHAWDSVTLWRARAIVRTSLETALAMLTVIPVYLPDSFRRLGDPSGDPHHARLRID